VAVADLVMEYNKAHPIVQTVAADHQLLTDKVSLATQAAADAKAKVDALTASYTGADGQAAALEAANNALTTAQNNLQAALGNTQKSINEVVTAQNSFNEVFLKVPQTYDDYIGAIAQGGPTQKQLETEIDTLTK